MEDIVLSRKEKRLIADKFKCSRVTVWRALKGDTSSYLTREIIAMARQIQEDRVERNRITNTESHDA